MSEELLQTDQLLAYHRELLRESGYELTEILARTSSSVVFLATEWNLGRTVAIKWLNLLNLDLTARNRFLREARILAHTHHPHIITIYKFLPIGSSYYIVMEYAEHGTLRERISAGGLGIGEVVDIGIAMCDALAAVHNQKVIHRDVKPANILLCTKTGEEKPVPKLADFGVARDVTATETTTGDSQPPGSPAYMPPEALGLRERRADERRDVYGLGATLYEALTGRPPRGDQVPELYQHLDRPPTPARTIRNQVPIWLDDILTEALAPEREGRYRTMREMLAELEEGKKSLEAEGPWEPPVKPPSGLLEVLQRWRVWVAVGGAIAVALAALLIVGRGHGLSFLATDRTVSPTAGTSAPIVASGTQTAAAILALTPSRSPSPTATSTETPSSTPSKSPSPTATSTEIPSSTPSRSPSPTATRTPTPSPTSTDTATEIPIVTATPRIVRPELVRPAQSETLKNPIIFEWEGFLGRGQAYQVNAESIRTGYITQSVLLSEKSWIVHLPAEKYGWWRWSVSVVQDGRTVSASDGWGEFVFDPWAGSGGGDGGGEVEPTDPRPTP
jgi:serine/threonine protein kinase